MAAAVNLVLVRDSMGSTYAPLSDINEQAVVDRSSIDLWRNYLIFSSSFSALHGTVDGVLGYTIVLLGKRIGFVANGLLYVTYSISALAFAESAVALVGSRMGLIYGMLGMLFYVLCFCIAVIQPNIKWEIFCMGASIGGVGAALLWTSQGLYYYQNMVQYATAKNVLETEASSTFAMVFAVFYLSLETIITGFATIMSLSESSADVYEIVFGVYSLIAFVALITITHIVSFDTDRDEKVSLGAAVCERVDRVVHVLRTQPRLALLMPYQFLFGFASSLFIGYVFGALLVEQHMEAYVGLLSAVVTIVAGAVAYPAHALVRNRLCEKIHVVIVSVACYSLCAVTLLLAPSSLLARWPLLLPYVVVHGTARGIWESTNKSLVADLCSELGATPLLSESFSASDMATSSYAAVYCVSGLGGAVGFFVGPWLTPRASLVGSALLAMCVVTVLALLRQPPHTATAAASPR